MVRSNPTALRAADSLAAFLGGPCRATKNKTERRIQKLVLVYTVYSTLAEKRSEVTQALFQRIQQLLLGCSIRTCTRSQTNALNKH
jgi:hypothetical protein